MIMVTMTTSMSTWWLINVTNHVNLKIPTSLHHYYVRIWDISKRIMHEDFYFSLELYFLMCSTASLIYLTLALVKIFQFSENNDYLKNCKYLNLRISVIFKCFLTNVCCSITKIHNFNIKCNEELNNCLHYYGSYEVEQFYYAYWKLNCFIFISYNRREI